MVALRGADIASVPIADAIEPIRLVDAKNEVLRTARALGISFGDAA